jgi:two-component system LytT family response regulator
VPSGPLALKAADRVFFVEPRDIDWIEADGDYLIVHVGTVQHRIRETISSIERRVPADFLVRVSRSAIVNLTSVREMQRWFRGNFVIILRDGTRVTTGAKYRDRIVRRI